MARSSEATFANRFGPKRQAWSRLPSFEPISTTLVLIQQSRRRGLGKGELWHFDPCEMDLTLAVLDEAEGSIKQVRPITTYEKW